MSSLKSRHSQASDLDRIFEKGVSGVEHMPQKTLSDEQIKAAAAGSKAGAGIWLLSHAKEILIGAFSFAVGVGGTLLVIHALQDKVPSQVPTEPTTVMTTDSLSKDPLSVDTAVYPVEASEHTVVRLENQSVPSSTDSKASSPKQETSQTTTRKATAAPTTYEPVVIKKTIVRRDTVQIHETVIVRDTVVIN